MSGKRNYFTETKLYRWFSAMGEIKYGERLGHFVTFLKTNRTLILYIYNLFIYLFIYLFFRSWTRERNLKQLSRGLHGINRALNVCFLTRKRKDAHFVGVVFSLLFFFPFTLMDHQALQDWLHDMSTLSLDVELLRHTQQLQHLLRKLLPADIVAGEAKYTKSVFLQSSGANLTCA